MVWDSEFDVDGIPVIDPQGRWFLDKATTTFGVAVSKSVDRVESVGDGDLSTSDWRTEAPLQSLGVKLARARSEAALEARRIAVQGWLERAQTVGRTFGGVRKVAAVRCEAISEVTRDGRVVALVATYRLPDVSFRSEEPITVDLVDGGNTLAELGESSAPISDAVIRVEGSPSVISVSDETSESGVSWSRALLPAQYIYNRDVPLAGTMLPGTMQEIVFSAWTGTGFVLSSKIGATYYLERFNAAHVMLWRQTVPSAVVSAVEIGGELWTGTAGPGLVKRNLTTGVQVAAYTPSTPDTFRGPVWVGVDSGGLPWTASPHLVFGAVTLIRWTTAGVQSASVTFSSPSPFVAVQFAAGAAGAMFVRIANSTSSRITHVSAAMAEVDFAEYEGADAGIIRDGTVLWTATAPGIVSAIDETFEAVTPLNSWGGGLGAGDGQFTSGVRHLALVGGRFFAADATRMHEFVNAALEVAGAVVIDCATGTAELIPDDTSAAPIDVSAGLSSVHWGGSELRLTPTFTDDPMSRSFDVRVEHDGTAATLTAKEAWR